MATDIDILAREILRTRERLNALYVHHTGQALGAIEKVMDRCVVDGGKGRKGMMRACGGGRARVVIACFTDGTVWRCPSCRDTFFDAQEALNFGVIDRIITKREAEVRVTMTVVFFGLSWWWRLALPDRPRMRTHTCSLRHPRPRRTVMAPVSGASSSRSSDELDRTKLKMCLFCARVHV